VAENGSANCADGLAKPYLDNVEILTTFAMQYSGKEMGIEGLYEQSREPKEPQYGIGLNCRGSSVLGSLALPSLGFTNEKWRSEKSMFRVHSTPPNQTLYAIRNAPAHQRHLI
jgi:hypothetical protein